MSLVTPSITYFPQKDKGRPLFNGSIYVGEPDLDPTIPANQKQVSLRLEDGSEIPVSQPLSTGAGGIVIYQGSYALMLVDGGYSVAAYNHKGDLEYYIPNNAGIFDASQITLTIDGNTTDVETYLNDDDVQTYADLQALNVVEIPNYRTTHVAERALGTGLGGGSFYWLSSDLSTEVSADPQFAKYVPPTSDLTGSGGAWVRKGFDKEAANAHYFGAIGDGSTDNTVALQAWLDHPAASKHLPAGTYLSDNLTIPNRFAEYTGEGMFESTIKTLSTISNSTYFIGSAAYVNNSTTGNDPIQWEGIRVWSDGGADSAFVWYGYESKFTRSYFWSQGAGDALRITSTGISGSTVSTTLVENTITECTIRGDGAGGNNSLAVRDTVNRMTDMLIKNNIIRGGAVFIQTCAGASITGNHFYGSADAEFRALAVGTLIADNYFENEVELENVLDESVVIGPGNNFNQRVTYSFGASGQRITSKANRYYGVADIYHNFFNPGKLLYSLNDTFETATPFNFSNPASTGRITVDGGHAYNLTPDGAVMEGSRTGATGKIRNKWWNSAAPTSGNWDRGDIVYNPFPTVDGNNMFLFGYMCTVTGTPGTWVPMYMSTVSPAT